MIQTLLEPERVRHGVPLPGEDVLQTMEQRFAHGGVVQLEKLLVQLRVPGEGREGGSAPP